MSWEKLLAPLRVRIANLVSRGLVSLVNDETKLQELQLALLDEETREAVERFQQYGFTSVPQKGAEAVVLFVGGRRDHGLVLAVDDRRYRLKGLEGGEVALYTDEGDSIVLRRGGTVEVTAATKVVVAAPLVELAGNTEAAMKGTSYRTAESTMNGTLGGQLTALGAALTTAGTDPTLSALASTAASSLSTAGTAAAAAGAAVTAFEGGAAGFLSTQVKLA